MRTAGVGRFQKWGDGVRKKVWLGLFFLTVLVNLAAWRSTLFCDWHVKVLFPLSVNLYGRLMSVFPFSVGEIMIVLGVLLLLAALVLLPVHILAAKHGAGRFTGGFYRAFAWILLVVFMVMTWNCFILYHASEFDEKYMTEKADRGYTDAELALVRDHIVEKLNELTEEMERDQEGYLVYEGDLTEEAILAMQALGEEYEQLSGYYPRTKAIRASGFLSQQYMTGYYFPFSMEANYNSAMYVVNMPGTLCHELAHLKGFIYEDDASFIGFLACIQSEDPFFRYSGYMSVLAYVEREFIDSIGRSASEYAAHPVICQQVYDDDLFLTAKAWERVEEKAVVETAVVKQASRQFTETTLKINGVEDGMKSYSRVVSLLLEYYDGILYNRYSEPEIIFSSLD